ncbi:hypothetical protein K8P10_001968 [Leucobacter sp. Psy1]|uniref:hypothetical protein n=1 Tax=Leucobacter sp. Psy1 TaxID=2875729 RepID=UPI001CD2F03A|nr:hypothetical protein [Leucobacter sp. Psy1]UBH06457.1 hypothetical protein K8P10_001968 [Leucobacter sp. Psy1]
MTTDETRDQSGNTPEQIDAGARIIHGNYRDEPWGEYGDKVWARGTFRAALRAAGLLVEGAPTDVQVERALIAYEAHAGCRGDEFREYVCPECGHLYATVEERRDGLDADALSEAVHRHRMTMALAAAAPPSAPATVPEDTDEHRDRESEAEDAESESEGHAATVTGTTPAPSETKCWCFDLPSGEHHAGCEPEPAPSTDREKLIAECDLADEELRKWVRVPVKNVRAALAAPPAPSADRDAWPEHWTKDDMLSDLHARHHSETGNMLAMDECGSPRCEFWSVASEVFDALAAPASAHIAAEAVQKLRGLGLDDSAIRERLAQATMLAAVSVSDELVQVIVRIAAKATVTSEDLHQMEHGSFNCEEARRLF